MGRSKVWIRYQLRSVIRSLACSALVPLLSDFHGFSKLDLLPIFLQQLQDPIERLETRSQSKVRQHVRHKSCLLYWGISIRSTCDVASTILSLATIWLRRPDNPQRHVAQLA